HLQPGGGALRDADARAALPRQDRARRPGAGRGRAHRARPRSQPGRAQGGRGDRGPRAPARSRSALPLRGGDGRRLRALPLRQGLRADQPDPQAPPRRALPERAASHRGRFAELPRAAAHAHPHQRRPHAAVARDRADRRGDTRVPRGDGLHARGDGAPGDGPPHRQAPQQDREAALHAQAPQDAPDEASPRLTAEAASGSIAQRGTGPFPLALSGDNRAMSLRDPRVQGVVWGGLAVGVLDTLLAVGLYKVTPFVVYQSVAGGLLGRATYQGGWATAALGMFLHFFIATTAAAVYTIA